MTSVTYHIHSVTSCTMCLCYEHLTLSVDLAQELYNRVRVGLCKLRSFLGEDMHWTCSDYQDKLHGHKRTMACSTCTTNPRIRLPAYIVP
jgi:hypothetical protein